MEERELWNEIVCMINKSNREIKIYGGKESEGNIELSILGLESKSILGIIVLYTSGICIDNWIRIIGQECYDHKGIVSYNETNKKEKDLMLEGLLVVAQDIVGGIFAINRKRFVEGVCKVWYFAPDTLEWECLDISYDEFLEWLIQGDVDKFYSSMRWENWREECKNVNFDKVLLIYPFLWSKECDLNRGSKKAVPYEELMGINFEYSKKINF